MKYTTNLFACQHFFQTFLNFFFQETLLSFSALEERALPLYQTVLCLSSLFLNFFQTFFGSLFRRCLSCGQLRYNNTICSRCQHLFSRFFVKNHFLLNIDINQKIREILLYILIISVIIYIIFMLIHGGKPCRLK